MNIHTLLLFFHVFKRSRLIDMLVLRSIGAGQARYYLDGRTTGAWIGRGCEPLAMAGPVSAPLLRAVLAGRDGDGRQLLRRLPTHRRPGFDLIFASPKSVSLLAALTGADRRPDGAETDGAGHPASRPTGHDGPGSSTPTTPRWPTPSPTSSVAPCGPDEEPRPGGFPSPV
jgi:hypothetical protein